MTLLQQILIVCPLIFLASFVDSIAGGGGLISLPAYLLTGMPAHMAYGSNKFSSSIGTCFSAYRFLKSGATHLKVAFFSAAFALLGSSIGANLALLLSDYFLRLTMIVLLPIMAVFILVHKASIAEESTFETLSRSKVILLSALIGFFIGMYDGFFGPGAGTFLILAYTTLMGFNIKTACSNTKIVNLSSNISALCVYIFAGKVYYAIAIPATFCAIAGGWLGSGLAIKKGAKFIKPVLILVLCGLFAKIIYDFFV